MHLKQKNKKTKKQEKLPFIIYNNFKKKKKNIKILLNY